MTMNDNEPKNSSSVPLPPVDTEAAYSFHNLSPASTAQIDGKGLMTGHKASDPKIVSDAVAARYAAAQATIAAQRAAQHAVDTAHKPPQHSAPPKTVSTAPRRVKKG